MKWKDEVKLILCEKSTWIGIVLGALLIIPCTRQFANILLINICKILLIVISDGYKLILLFLTNIINNQDFLRIVGNASGTGIVGFFVFLMGNNTIKLKIKSIIKCLFGNSKN